MLKKKYNLAPFKNSYQVEVLKIQLLANVVYENNFTIEYVKISLNLNLMTDSSILNGTGKRQTPWMCLPENLWITRKNQSLHQDPGKI